MRRIIILNCILVCSLVACDHPPAEDCKRFRTGKFRLRSEYDNSIFLVERNESFQVETNTRTGESYKLRIKWTGPCQYDLIKAPDDNTAVDRNSKPPDDKLLHIRITKTTKDYYVFDAYETGVLLLYTDTLEFVNPQ